jgi:transcriptional regulator with XRE-family HTH domain
MAGVKRPKARIIGASRAQSAAATVGAEVRASRVRRRMREETLASKVGVTRARLAQLEAGKAAGAPPEVWFALAEALDRYLRFEFARDPQAETADAGHLDIQELLLREAKPGGWERAFEARSRPDGSDLSIDVRLIDRKGRRLVIGECWNTFGDLGKATRSSERKLGDAEAHAVAIAGDCEPFQVGLVWVIRDTKANRALLNRYPHIFEARFGGSSAAWIRVLTNQGSSLPKQPGLVSCAARARKIFARRRPRG